jgi:hypothetical protein
MERREVCSQLGWRERPLRCPQERGDQDENQKEPHGAYTPEPAQNVTRVVSFEREPARFIRISTDDLQDASTVPLPIGNPARRACA